MLLFFFSSDGWCLQRCCSSRRVVICFLTHLKVALIWIGATADLSLSATIPVDVQLVEAPSGSILFGSVISVELLASEYGCDAGYHILELLLAPASRLGLLEFFVLTRVRRSGCSSFGWSLLRHGNLPLLHRVLLQLASHGAMETQLA